ncbi:MAG: tRNA threonylcarbamoyladenosine biosynthesis protein [Parcubacteria group bacterium Gr01-1014_13]|nr:MAG: tRNA threonylcarbamoyladenosine biosynthesis protein [Parcubacteria group bacterium Gr01-1014_13]
MKIVDQENLSEAVEALQNGQTVVFPTETSYGLGCDATNQDAVDEIFKIKQRKSDKPLLVVVPNIEMAKKYLVWNDLLEDLSKKYWPGPLTIVGEWNKKENLATGVVAADNTIAVRVTNFPLTKFLSEKLNKPLVATSANLADAGDVYDSKQILAMFSDKSVKPDILIDGGELPQNPPTTIVSVIDNNLKILRQGQIKIN